MFRVVGRQAGGSLGLGLRRSFTVLKLFYPRVFGDGAELGDFERVFRV